MTTNAADQHQRPTKRHSALRDAGRLSASRRTDNNGRAAARPTLGSQTGTVNVSAWAFAPGTTPKDALANVPTANGTASTSTTQPIGLANYQIAVLQ